jgi:hypothetical protein
VSNPINVLNVITENAKYANGNTKSEYHKMLIKSSTSAFTITTEAPSKSTKAILVSRTFVRIDFLTAEAYRML